jgi:hypothetical protein
MRALLTGPWLVRGLVLVVALVLCGIFLHAPALAFVIASVAGLIALQMKYGRLYRKR